MVGMSRSVDVFGGIEARVPTRPAFLGPSPNEALLRDWVNIGGDLKRSIDRMKPEIERAQQTVNG